MPVFFYLFPLNEAARTAVTHPCNKKFRDIDADGNPRLSVGLFPSKDSPRTLLTIGRNGDIQLARPDISRIQCSFELDHHDYLVMFYDRSHGGTCKVYGDDCTPFLPDRARKVVVHPGLNSHIGIGGPNSDWYTFRLDWVDREADELAKLTHDHFHNFSSLRPQQVLTIDYQDSPTTPIGEPKSATSKSTLIKVRWQAMKYLGKGSFGAAQKVFDVDRGRIMAVKIVLKPASKRPKFSDRRRARMRQEAQTLSSLVHEHIVRYIDSQERADGSIEIFMDLQDGTLRSLVDNSNKSNINDIALKCFHDILRAIDFLSLREIIHRDIKPDNILYKHSANMYTFVLSDFGLSTSKGALNVGFWGSPPFMPPEAFRVGMSIDNGDIWSFYMTMLDIMRPDFRKLCYDRNGLPDDYHDGAVFESEDDDDLVHLREMARRNPETRATAAQLLVKYFDGRGLSTPRNTVQPISPASDADDNLDEPAVWDFRGRWLTTGMISEEKTATVNKDLPMAHVPHAIAQHPEVPAVIVPANNLGASPLRPPTKSASIDFESPVGIQHKPAGVDDIAMLSESMAKLSTQKNFQLVPGSPAEATSKDEPESAPKASTERANGAAPSSNHNHDSLFSSKAASGDVNAQEEASSDQQPIGRRLNAQAGPRKGQVAMLTLGNQDRLQRSRSPPTDRDQKRQRIRSPESSSAPIDC